MTCKPTTEEVTRWKIIFPLYGANTVARKIWVAVLQAQGFCPIFAVFLAPIIPRMGFYGLKHKASSIIQDTLTNM